MQADSLTRGECRKCAPAGAHLTVTDVLYRGKRNQKCSDEGKIKKSNFLSLAVGSNKAALHEHPRWSAVSETETALTHS